MFLLSKDPVTEFLLWFNTSFVTPPITIKFTLLDEASCVIRSKQDRGLFDPYTWTVWIDVRTRYECMTDVLGHISAHCLLAVDFPSRANDHGKEWKKLYKQIRQGWGEHIETVLGPTNRLVKALTKDMLGMETDTVL